jgi:hypothetical protein
LDCPDQVDDAFLTGDTADEQQELLGCIDAVFVQCIGGVNLVLLLQIDPVIYDRDAIRLNIEEPIDIRFGPAGDGDNGVSHFERRLFNPNAKIVSTSELFSFPRS